jgi:hypothetical protein
MWGRGALAAVGGVWVLLAAPAGAAGALYQWTDREGVVRYTPDPDRVPSSARNTMKRVEGQAAPAPGDSAPLRPGALPAVMGSELPEDLLGPEPAPGDPADLDRQIESLRQAIERDRKALRELVGERKDGDADWELEIETLANRLPALQAKLEELEELRRRREAPPGAGP